MTDRKRLFVFLSGLLLAFLYLLLLGGGISHDRSPRRDRAPRDALTDAPERSPPSPKKAEPDSEDAATAPARTGSLAFRVVARGDDSPIEGALVRIHPPKTWDRLVAEAATDADGLARIDGLPDQTVYAFQVRAEGYAVETSIWCKSREKPPVNPVRLRRPSGLTGEVRDALTDAPIAGARVVSRTGPTAFMDRDTRVDPGPVTSSTMTADDGTFRLPDVAEILVVTAEGYATARMISWSSPARFWGLSCIRLVPTGVVAGIVTGPDGEPVPRAMVIAAPAPARWGVRDGPDCWCLRDASIGGSPQGLLAPECAWAGPDGSYRLATLAPGVDYRVQAGKDGFSPSAPRMGIRVAPGEEPRIDFRLRGEVSVDLRVSRQDGHPIRSLRFHLRPNNPVIPARDFPPDDTGRIRVRGIEPGQYRARFTAQGCRRLEVERTLSGEEPWVDEIVLLPIPGEDPDEIITLIGVVVDEVGNPVAGAQVTCAGGDPHEQLTGKDGAFSYRKRRGLLPSLYVNADRHSHTALSGWWMNSAPGGIRVVLERWARVEVPIRAPVGAPEPEFLSYETRRDKGGRFTGEKLGEDGVLTLDLKPGKTTLEIRVPGYVPVRFDLELRGGESRILPALRLDRGVGVEIAVTDQAGRPIGPATILCDEPGHMSGMLRIEGPNQVGLRSRTVETDQTGRTRVTGFREGEEVDFFVSADGFAGRYLRWIAKGTGDSLPVRLAQLEKLRGEVLDARGVPVGFATVRARRESGENGDGAETTADTDNAGRFELSLPAGRYRLHVRVPGPDRTEVPIREFEVRKDEQRFLSLRVEQPR